MYSYPGILNLGSQLLFFGILDPIGSPTQLSTLKSAEFRRRYGQLKALVVERADVGRTGSGTVWVVVHCEHNVMMQPLKREHHRCLIFAPPVCCHHSSSVTNSHCLLCKRLPLSPTADHVALTVDEVGRPAHCWRRALLDTLTAESVSTAR